MQYHGVCITFHGTRYIAKHGINVCILSKFSDLNSTNRVKDTSMVSDELDIGPRDTKFSQDSFMPCY